MAQRVDERSPTRTELLCYDKALKLSAHVMSICKPKENNPNNKHIPKRNAGIGRQLMECAVEMGADILEANTAYYVGKNIAKEKRLENYEARVRLQGEAKSLTYRMEHIYRILYYDKPFAESTTKMFLDLLQETRDLLTRWRESDMREAKTLEESD